MRPLTTLRFGWFGSACGAASLIVAPLLVASACGEGEKECTSIGCASEASQAATGAGGSSAGSSGSGSVAGGDLLGNEAVGGAGALADEDVCQGVTLTATASPVNVLILLDRSVSMLDPVDPNVAGSPSRWDAVTSALRSFVNSAQAADARVGLQFFGLTNGNDDCGAAKYSVPAVAVAPLVGNRTALLSAIDTTLPGSFTPTAPAVAGALEYALQVAQRPENANIPSVVILASDGIPSECGPTGSDGAMIVSFGEIIDTLRQYSQPPVDGSGNPTQPPIRTYLVGTQELASNANSLAQAGGGQAFLVGGAAGAGVDLEAKFLDALLRIVVKPLSCEVELPQMAPGTNEAIDFEQVRVRFTGATSGVVTEFPRSEGPATCGANSAWYYDDQLEPTKIIFCKTACQNLGAGDLKVELGCAPERIVR